jgi:hypothetical protein
MNHLFEPLRYLRLRMASLRFSERPIDDELDHNPAGYSYVKWFNPTTNACTSLGFS